MATADGKRAKLGDVVKDVITGFEGVVIGMTDWLTGCRTLSVRPKELKDGKPQDSVGIDEPQVRVLSSGTIQVGEAGELEEKPLASARRDRGGPHETPQRQR